MLVWLFSIRLYPKCLQLVISSPNLCLLAKLPLFCLPLSPLSCPPWFPLLGFSLSLFLALPLPLLSWSSPVCWPCSLYYSLSALDSFRCLWQFLSSYLPLDHSWSGHAINLDNLNIFFFLESRTFQNDTHWFLWWNSLKNKFPTTLKFLKGRVFFIKWQTVLYALLAGEKNFIFDLVLRSTYVSWVRFFFFYLLTVLLKGAEKGFQVGPVCLM